MNVSRLKHIILCLLDIFGMAVNTKASLIMMSAETFKAYSVFRSTKMYIYTAYIHSI